MTGAKNAFRRAAQRALAPEVLEDLATVSEVASEVVAEAGVRVLLVGGMVRDVLLGRASRDIDLVVAGQDGIAESVTPAARALAAGLAAALAGRVREPSELQTWRIELPGSRRLDLALARRETYASPAALPSVAPGDVGEDLARRDFTINAMAVEIGGRWGEVLDPHGGGADLDRGLLRVLHADSFRDDPTRILRGVELAARLSFELEAGTAELAREALAAGTLRSLSAARWRRAWRRAFVPLLESGAEDLARGLGLAQRVGLLEALDPRLRLDEPASARVARLAERTAEARFQDARPDRLLARALAWQDSAVAGALAERWGLSSQGAREWSSFGDRLRAARRDLQAGEPAPLSRLDAALAAFSAEEICLLELSPTLAGAVERYRASVAPFRLRVDGHDLKARGHVPGPRFGAALERTRRARLDGLIGEDEELEYACRELEAMET